jgi:hypothetical protein
MFFTVKTIPRFVVNPAIRLIALTIRRKHGSTTTHLDDSTTHRIGAFTINRFVVVLQIRFYDDAPDQPIPSCGQESTKTEFD